MMLGAMGGVGGIVIGVLAVGVMRGHLASTMPRAATIGLDATVLGFALGVSLLAGLAVGLVPAWRGDDQAPAALSQSGRSGTGPRRRRLIRGLVTAEIALSIMSEMVSRRRQAMREKSGGAETAGPSVSVRA